METEEQDSRATENVPEDQNARVEEKSHRQLGFQIEGNSGQATVSR